ncbi:transcription factor WhiB [Yimella lutea]|uniref:Transcription factor WhiB n=1 Tax=Yimella lutea TaxID=587872 RepID=A0A542EEV6_9MICO|nr:WhiB family transcriptional regulator [Yimella lutea]TQJ13839.1 transcription factor WhiB [Yimella lutea]
MTTTATDALTQALVRMAEAGDRPRCGEPGAHELWLSEDTEDRAQAARWCAGCSVLAECAAAAGELKASFGVWAGRDYGERASRRTVAEQ